MTNVADDSRPARSLFWLASGMFFLSGGTGLAYQVIWFKRFAHVWGSSSLAFAAVGGSFLCGLGVGAYWIGHRADLVQRPLRWYGICELAIGAAALAIPLELNLLMHFSAAFYADLPNNPLLRYLLQFFLTLLIVGPPCALMGGTLPLLIRELTARHGALDESIAWLYAINTFGAAAGCFLTGFLLLPTLELVWTNNLAAALNITIGIAAIWLSRRAPARHAPRAAEVAHEAPPAGGSSLAALYVAVTLSGLAALMLEMTWSRQLALVLGGSTYAYSATLFVVLLGIGAGSLIFHLGLRRAALSPWLPIVVVGILAVGCLLGKLSLPWLVSQIGERRADRLSLPGNALVCMFGSGMLELIPAVAMGILFPLFVDLTRQQASRVGRAVGDVYAWNTFGSIAGASFTAVLLFPRIGTLATVALATALYIVTLLLVLPWQSVGERLRGLACLAAGAAVVGGILLPQDPLLTNLGGYLYGDQKIYRNSLTPLFFFEGASSNVLVTQTEKGVRSLRVNGKVDASNDTDMITQLGLAYLPRLFHCDARSVLVIGFGSGTTLGASLLFPDTDVTGCEIEPAVYEAGPLFSATNHRPYEKTRSYFEQRNAELPAAERLSPEQIEQQARLTMVFGDGRTLLQGSEQKYDLIISEPSNPWLAGVSNLFTQEFFQSAKARLNSGGVLAQWIQTYQFTLADYLMIVRTMRTVFPHCGVVAITGNSDTLLLASTEPLLPDRAKIEELQKIVDASPEIAHDLSKWLGSSDLKVLLLAYYTINQAALDKLVAQGTAQRVNTDLNLRLEFDAPLHMFEQLPLMLSASQLSDQHDIGWRYELGELLGIPAEGAEQQIAAAIIDIQRKKIDDALLRLHKALEINPDLPEVYSEITKVYLGKNQQQEAIAVFRDWIKARPEGPEPRWGLFNSLKGAGQHREAIAAIEPLLEHHADDAALHLSIGQEQLQLGERGSAAAHFRRALELDPGLPLDRDNLVWVNDYAWLLATSLDDSLRDGKEAVRLAQQMCQVLDVHPWHIIDTLAAAHAEAGQFDAASAIMRKVLERAETEGNRQVAGTARERIAKFQAHEPIREDASQPAETPPPVDPK